MGDESVGNVALALRTAKRLQDWACFQRASERGCRHNKEQMQNERRQSDRREKEEEQHRDIPFGELNNERREFLAELEQAGALYQIAVARIESAV